MHLNPSRPLLPEPVALEIFGQILKQAGCHLWVAVVGDELVSTCMLAMFLNPMRGGRPYAFVENVVTHAEHRRNGHGRAVIEAALTEAWNHGAHHVTLMSGRKDPGVHLFYESCGFEGGIHAAYWARSSHSEY